MIKLFGAMACAAFALMEPVTGMAHGAAIARDTDRAMPLYEQADAPDRGVSVLFDRGIDDDSEGRHDRAVQDYGEVIRLDPGNARAFNNRCFDEAILGKLDLAVADCRESLRLAPNNAGAFDSLGLAYLKLNHLDAAIAYYDAALKIEPALAVSLFGRGIAKRRKGDIAGGNADIAAARAIWDNIADNMAKLGVRL